MAAFVPTVNPRPHIGESVGPDEAVLVASGAYTATASQEFVINGEAEGIEVTVNVTARANVASTTPSIEVFDIASQTWITLLTGTALTVAATALLLVSHHAPTSANVSATHVVGGLMRVTMTHGTADAHTYSISVRSV